MRLTKTLSLLSTTLFLGGLTTNIPAYTENLPFPTTVAQSANDNNSAIIQAKAEMLVDLFFAEKFDEVLKALHPELQSELTIEKLQQMSMDTKTENGNFQKRVESKVINTVGSDIVQIKLAFDNVTEDWLIIFNNQEQIIGVDIPTSKDIDTIAKEFVDSLATGDFAKARSYLHPFLKQDIFPQKIQSRWEKIIQQQGNFEKIISMDIRKGSSIDKSDIVVLNLGFEKSNQTILIIFDDSKSIIGVDFVRN